MSANTLAEVLEHEHREIDDGIHAFLSDPEQTEAIARAMGALRRHIYLEEEFLFPPLYEAGMVPPIFVMLREHGEIWRTMDALEGSLDAGTYARTADLCYDLLALLERHNAKEESVIYPEADDVLSAHTAAALRSFLDTGRIPEGWACRECA